MIRRSPYKKNDLVDQILYTILVPSKKTAPMSKLREIFLKQLFRMSKIVLGFLPASGNP